METITGTTDDDRLDGTDGGDTIDGLAGQDTINGGAGDDTIYGGSGIDTLHGDDGDDYIDGGPAQTFSGQFESLWGGRGADTLIGRADRASLYGGDGNDLLEAYGRFQRLDGGHGADTLVGHGGVEVLFVREVYHWSEQFYASDSGDTITTGPGFDVIHFWGGSHTITDFAFEDMIYIGGFPGSHVYDADTNRLFLGDPDTTTAVLDIGNGIDDGEFRTQAVAGGLSSTSLIGYFVRPEPDVFTSPDGGAARAGSDFGDSLVGSAAADSFKGHGGNDTLYGGGGRDLILGNDGDDLITNSDPDGIVASAFATLIGGAGDDTVHAYASGEATRLSFQTGPRTIAGDGLGEDLITTSGTGGYVHLEWNAGNDTVEAGDGWEALTLALEATESARLAYDGRTLRDGSGDVDALSGIDAVFVTDLADEAAEFLIADDAEGATPLEAVHVILKFGNDAVEVEGGAHVTVWSGWDGNEFFAGGNTILAGSGSSALDVRDEDTLFGGAGADSFIVDVNDRRAFGGAVIGDFSAEDQIVFTRLDDREATFGSDWTTWNADFDFEVDIEARGNQTLVMMFPENSSNPAVTLTLLGRFDGEFSVTTSENGDQVVTYDGTVENAATAGTLDGDVLSGSAANDEIWAMHGDDEVIGGAGNDILHGGEGDDVIWGDGA